MTDKNLIASAGQIESWIYVIRGQKVMLDEDLSTLYSVETKRLNEQVRRNSERFPEDFMFQLTAEEFANLKSQIATSSLRSQFATSNASVGRGGRRHIPFAFTEQGVSMLSSVLHSDRAIQVNIEIMRTFVQLRQMLASNVELSRKLATLEKKYDIQFKAVFDVIRQLMIPLEPKKKRPIGFAPWEKS